MSKLHAFFGDEELSREFMTSQNLSDVENFIVSTAKRDGKQAPTESEIKEITDRYQKHYIENLQKTFGLSDRSMIELHQEFKDVSSKMLEILKVNEGRNADLFDANKKYMETYPYLYFSVIPRQIIESRLAAKTVEENKILRDKLSVMSMKIGELVKTLSEAQVEAGIPPVVKAVFESIPDPLSAQYDTKFQNNKGDMDTYHKISSYLMNTSPSKHSDFLLRPIEQLQTQLPTRDVTKEEIESLSRFLSEFRLSSSNEFVVPE